MDILDLLGLDIGKSTFHLIGHDPERDCYAVQREQAPSPRVAITHGKIVLSCEQSHERSQT